MATRLWSIYVFRAMVYGAAVTMASHTVHQAFDRAHRRCGRILLGFNKSAPSPVVIAELGWHRISNHIIVEKCSLLSRIALSRNPIISAVAHVASGCSKSWLRSTSAIIKNYVVKKPPADRPQWQQLKQHMVKADAALEHEAIASLCQRHHNTASYSLTRWVADQEWAINNFLHNKAVEPDQARQISRLICGGQGLRGGDPKSTPQPTRTNCCVFCLEKGNRSVESLHHVLFECEAYEHLRRTASIREAFVSWNTNIFRIHRKWWSWRQVKDLRATLASFVVHRHNLRGGRVRGARGRLQARADACW